MHVIPAQAAQLTASRSSLDSQADQCAECEGLGALNGSAGLPTARCGVVAGVVWAGRGALALFSENLSVRSHGRLGLSDLEGLGELALFSENFSVRGRGWPGLGDLEGRGQLALLSENFSVRGRN